MIVPNLYLHARKVCDRNFIFTSQKAFITISLLWSNGIQVLKNFKDKNSKKDLLYLKVFIRKRSWILQNPIILIHKKYLSKMRHLQYRPRECLKWYQFQQNIVLLNRRKFAD